MSGKRWLLTGLLSVALAAATAPALAATAPSAPAAAARPTSGAVAPLHNPTDDRHRVRLRTQGDDAVRPPGGLRTGAKPLTPPTKIKILVMRVYWTAKVPAVMPSTATTKDVVLNQVAAWFHTVSRGKQTMTGTVTPVLKLSGVSCSGFSNLMKKARAKAKAAGFKTTSYNRSEVVAPQCRTNSLGQLPGPYTWIFDTLDLPTVAHELGHNLGLEHAWGRHCGSASDDSVRFPMRGTCSDVEYDDAWDAMGISPEQYSVSVLKRLGWAGRTATATTSGTYLLAPAEHSGTGLQGVRVKVSSKLSYWLEYRTVPTKIFDDDGLVGVQIRRDTGSKSLQLIDASPGNPVQDLIFPDPDLFNPPLLKGTRITTPEHVRLETLSQNAAGARVRVTFKDPATPPSAPVLTDVIQPGYGWEQYQLFWRPPASDGGDVIVGYTITHGSDSQFVPGSGSTTSATYNDEDEQPASARFTVRAVTEWGSAVSNAKAVEESGPNFTVTAPASGATVEGNALTVHVTATAFPLTHTAPSYACAWLDNHTDETFCSDRGHSPYDMYYGGAAPAGAHTLHVTAYDENDSSRTTSRPITVVHSTPVLTITAPTSGQTVTSSDLSYAFTLTHPELLDQGYLDVYVDGSWADSVDLTGGARSGTTQLWQDAGDHTIRLEGYDAYGRLVTSPTVTFHYAPPG